MAYGNRVKTDALSTTYSTAQYPLGTKFVESADEVVAAVHTDGTTSLGLQGSRTWVFVRATVALAAYDCVVQNDVSVVNSRFLVRPTTSAGDNSLRVQGIAQHAIAITEYGWIVCDGQAVAKASAGITCGLFLDTDGGTASGNVDDNTAAGTLIGIALTATGSPVSGTVAMDVRLGQ